MTKLTAWLFAAILACGVPALAQAGPVAAPTSHVEVETLAPPSVHFDVDKAVNAYLARVSGKARARSDAYFEGGEVLQVVDVFYAVAVAALLLWFGISARMRDRAQRMTPSRFWQVPIYAIQYLILTTVLTLPLAIYEGFFREHAYGLSNQSFLAWSGDFLTSFGVELIAFTIAITLIYFAIRRTGRAWWIWGGAIGVVFLTVVVAVQPVFIAPLFNHYSKLPDSTLKSTILAEARANGIPAGEVYVFDASRQSNRISANVSGLFGTTRISLTDNLLNDCTPSEVLAVVGHEMGHYVMDHAAIIITWYGILLLIALGIADLAFRKIAAVFGKRWGVGGIDDVAGMPLLMAILTVLALLCTPVTNTISRSIETQADIFGLNAVRLPDAFATVVLKLSTYRKLDPSPWEEFVFYDHPSGRTRIMEAMRWKAEHLNDPDIASGQVSPQ